MEYILTFLEGIASFISPCLLPMVPIYISYFIGEDDDNNKKAILNSTVLSTENSTGICNMISNQVYFYGNPIYDMYDKLKGLNFETFKNSIKDINLDNRSVVILDNKNSRG